MTCLYCNTILPLLGLFPFLSGEMESTVCIWFLGLKTELFMESLERLNTFLGWQAPSEWNCLLWNIIFFALCVGGFSVLFAVAAGVPRWHLCLWVLPHRSKYYCWRLHKWPGADFHSALHFCFATSAAFFCLTVFVPQHFLYLSTQYTEKER